MKVQRVAGCGRMTGTWKDGTQACFGAGPLAIVEVLRLLAVDSAHFAHKLVEARAEMQVIFSH